MAYEVTATRRRPRGFDQMVGQDFVVETLRKSVEAGRIAHAYLFSGPRGCGKTSAARILAKALNCGKGPTADPCGTCPSCQEVARGASLDVIEIDGASNTSVDNVRALREEVLFAPNGGRYKVYIIDEVHMLSQSAFNALLKTIEEPPPYVVFIFATTELHKVPATIRSRCQQFSFRLIPVERIKALLAEAAAELGIAAQPDALLWIAREATGSLRDAYTLFDQVAAFSGGEISSEKIRATLGVSGHEATDAFAADCAEGARARAFAALDEALARGVSAEQFLADLADYYRGVLLARSGVEREELLGAPLAAFSPRVLEVMDADRAESALATCIEAYRNLRSAPDPRLELELAVSRICMLRDWISPVELRRELRALKARLGAAQGGPGQGGARPAGAEQARPPVAPAEPPRAAPTDGSERSVPETGARAVAGPLAPGPEAGAADAPDPESPELKARIVERTAKTKPMVAKMLEKSLPWRVEGGKLLIPCAEPFPAEAINAERLFLAAAVAELAGLNMACEAVHEPAGAEAPAAEAPVDDEGAEMVKKMFRGSEIPGGR